VSVTDRLGAGGWNICSFFVDRHLAEGRGDRVALRCGDDCVTYAELGTMIDRVANVLTDLGVHRGDRVLLALSDGVELVASWYAAQKLGAVTAECYTFLGAKDYSYFLSYADPAVVVADRVTIGAIREAAGQATGGSRTTLVVGAVRGVTAAAGDAAATAAERQETALGAGEVSFEEAVAAAPPAFTPVRVAPDDVAIWKFTTGSTGAPKACVHPARSPFASFESYALGVLAMTEDDIVLPVPKLFFGYARDLAALYPFGAGGAGIVFPERTTADRIFELIARHRPTILVNVPTMMSAMVVHPDAGDQDLTCLRLCTSAGEALPTEVHRKWDELFGVEVLDGMGSSEAYHVYLSIRPGTSRRGTMGVPVPGYTARIVGENGAELADGEIGRLEVTGPTMALGYHGDDERSRRTFDGDTVRSEDLCIRDADGYFSYRGRADDLLKVGGIWVAPAEIEDCLLQHPGVLECAVVGYSRDGLVKPRAYVVASDAASPGLAADLLAFTRERLAGHKYPRDIRVVRDLPRTTNGKLDRSALRAAAQSETPDS
jgi:benzoate-CoA ligase family protein